MANNDIKQKIILEGEQEYKRALKDAQRELKTLRSELKAETAELGKNANEQEKARIKAQNLKKQIEEQKKVVDTYKKALEEVKEKYSDDEDAVAKWTQKLNDARTTLANMQNDLEGVGTTFKKVETDAAMGTVATKSFADSLSSISQAGAAVSGAIEDIFSGMIDIVRSSIGAIWEDLVDLAARSNAWGDLAGFWNTNAANVEKWDRAVTAATDNFSDFTAAVLKINNLDDKQQKKIAELTGISGVNYEDRWEYATAVLGEMAKMPYDKMLKASEEIFGAKRATGVLDLLNDWADIQENLKRFDAENGGLGLNNEQIDDMVSLDVKIHTLQETWKAFVDEFEATHFAKLAITLTGDAQAILDAFIEFMDADNQSERDEALKKLEENVKKFFTDLGEALSRAAEAMNEVGTELKGSENGIVRLLGNVLTGLSNVLNWFTVEGNIDKVIAGFEALAAFWLVGKGVQFAATIASIAANISIIKGFSIGGAAAAGAGAAASGAASGGGSTVTSVVGAIVAKALPVVGGAGLVIADSLNNHGNDELINGQSYHWEHDKEGNSITVFDDPNADKYEHTLDHLGTVLEEVEESIDLDREYTEQEKESAIQDWWDARRNATQGLDSWDEVDKAYDWMTEVLGDSAGEVVDSIIHHLDNTRNQDSLQDIPANWWRTGGQDENGITKQDVATLTTMPDKTATAVARVVGGIHFDVDGQKLANAITPYVSQNLASSVATTASV